MKKDEHINSKLNILIVNDILTKYATKSHPMNRKAILEKMNNYYRIEVNPKTVTAMIETLNEFHRLYSHSDKKFIEHSKDGYYTTKSLFTPVQAQFLCDAIYSSKSIGQSDSDRLINILKNYIPKDIRINIPDVYKQKESKENTSLFRNISIINKAITKGKKIEYKKYKFDKKGNQLEPSDDDKSVVVSPYLVVNSDSKYYMICTDEYHETGSARRLDLLTNFKILEDQNINKALKETIIGKNPKKFMESRPYMYISEPIIAEIILENEYRIRDVRDNFKNPIISLETDGIHAKFETDSESLYYWLLQYTNEIKVLKPISLRNKIAMTLQRSLNAYKTMEVDDISNISLDIPKLIKNYFNTFRMQKDLNTYNKDLITNEFINYLENFTNIYSHINFNEDEDININVLVNYKDQEIRYNIILDFYTETINDEIVNNIINKINYYKQSKKENLYYIGVQLDKDSTYAYNPNYKHLDEYLEEIKWTKIADKNNPPKWLDYYVLKLK